jgi:hypothetical protein
MTNPAKKTCSEIKSSYTYRPISKGKSYDMMAVSQTAKEACSGLGAFASWLNGRACN